MTNTVFAADPMQVEIVSHSDWWQPWLPFAGSALLFLGAMVTLWLTNRAARKRQERELQAQRIENVADRAAARAESLRTEVAAVLAARPATLDSQRALFEATIVHRRDLMDQSGAVSPADSSKKLFDARSGHLKMSDELEQAVIRALLLTNDASIDAALQKVRAIAHNWYKPIEATTAGPSEAQWDSLQTLGAELTSALDELESATRKLTAI
jgi:hypothetical protein